MSCVTESRRSALISSGVSTGRTSMRGLTRTKNRSRGKRMSEDERRRCEGIVGPNTYHDRYDTRCSRNATAQPDPTDGRYYCWQHGPTNNKAKKRFVQKTYAAGS